MKAKVKQKDLKKLSKLLRVSNKAVKHRKKLGKALFSLMFLVNNWDKSETKILFKNKKK